MNVYFVENECPNRDSSGGVMSYIINLAKYLNHDKVNCYLLYASNTTKNFNYKIKNIKPVKIANKLLSNFRYLLTLFLKAKCIPDNKNTIIHVQRPENSIPFIIFHKRSRIVCTIHGPRHIAIKKKKGRLVFILTKTINKIVFKYIHHTIVVDNVSYNYFNKYKHLSSKLSRISIGVDTDFYKRLGDNKYLKKQKRIPLDKKIVLFVGRLELEKNIYFIINSAVVLKKINKNIMLLITGSGSLKKELVDYAKNIGLNDIIFLEEQPNKEMPIIYSLADILVLASEYEGSPTVIKEALSCQVPIVSTNVGDVKDTIKDINNCYITDKKPEVFATIMNKALTKNILSYNQIKKINSRISAKSMTAKTYDIYKKVTFYE